METRSPKVPTTASATKTSRKLPSTPPLRIPDSKFQHRPVATSVSLPTPSPERGSTAKSTWLAQQHIRVPLTTGAYLSPADHEKRMAKYTNSPLSPSEESDRHPESDQRGSAYFRRQLSDKHQHLNLNDNAAATQSEPEQLGPDSLPNRSDLTDHEALNDKRHKVTGSGSSFASRNSSYATSHSRVSSASTAVSCPTSAIMAHEPGSEKGGTLEPSEQDRRGPYKQEEAGSSGTDLSSKGKSSTALLPSPLVVRHTPSPQEAAQQATKPSESELTGTQGFSSAREGLGGSTFVKSHKRALSAPNLPPSSYSSGSSPSSYRRFGKLPSALNAPMPMSDIPEEQGTGKTPTRPTFTARSPSGAASASISASASRTSLPMAGLGHGDAAAGAEVAGRVGVPAPVAVVATTAAGGLPFYADSLEAANEAILEGRERCLFVENCNTGSTLRKAISHFFGRNKSCTKRIPSHIWVYYCRKHYQRIRYRNAETYPQNQMDLILLQLRRLQAWDIRCRQEGREQRIEYWTLCLRKREKNRLNTDADSSDGEGADVTAPPEWLKRHIDGNFSTAEIIDIAEHIRRDVHSGSLPGIPEVEFLPEIPAETSTQAGRPPRRVRRQAASVDERKLSKRKASGPAMEAAAAPAGPPPTPVTQTPVGESAGEPSAKRARTGFRGAHARSQTLNQAFTFPPSAPPQPLAMAQAQTNVLPAHRFTGPPLHGPTSQISPYPESFGRPQTATRTHSRSRSIYGEPALAPRYPPYPERRMSHADVGSLSVQPGAAEPSPSRITLPSLSAQFPEHVPARFGAQDARSHYAAGIPGEGVRGFHHRSTSMVSPHTRPMWENASLDPRARAGNGAARYYPQAQDLGPPSARGYGVPAHYEAVIPRAPVRSIERTLPPLQRPVAQSYPRGPYYEPAPGFRFPPSTGAPSPAERGLVAVPEHRRSEEWGQNPEERGQQT